jgi:hypothetical protein
MAAQKYSDLANWALSTASLLLRLNKLIAIALDDSDCAEEWEVQPVHGLAIE